MFQVVSVRVTFQIITEHSFVHSNIITYIPKYLENFYWKLLDDNSWDPSLLILKGPVSIGMYQCQLKLHSLCPAWTVKSFKKGIDTIVVFSIYKIY